MTPRSIRLWTSIHKWTSLVCTLFLLSALCNSMIDVLNKHFQNSLGVSKAHSTFVQAV